MDRSLLGPSDQCFVNSHNHWERERENVLFENYAVFKYSFTWNPSLTKALRWELRGKHAGVRGPGSLEARPRTKSRPGASHIKSRCQPWFLHCQLTPALFDHEVEMRWHKLYLENYKCQAKGSTCLRLQLHVTVQQKQQLTNNHSQPLASTSSVPGTEPWPCGSHNSSARCENSPLTLLMVSMRYLRLKEMKCLAPD